MISEDIYPKDWRTIIKEKRVIFYNTSLASLLQNREQHIKKMKRVFNFFKEQQEVVLWWRPHPLEQSTVRAMMPELLEEYLETRSRYTDEKIGILDESGDMYRGIVISDAYYGDWSSVVGVYRRTGKPILLANDKVSGEFHLEIADFTMLDNKLWFFGWNINSLFSFDILTHELREENYLREYKKSSSELFNSILNIEDTLILVPSDCDSIEMYNIREGKFGVIALQERNSAKYIKALARGNKIYFMPATANHILIINYQTGKVERQVEIEMHNLGMQCNKNYTVSSEALYFSYFQKNIIGQFLFEKEKIEYFTVGNSEDRIYGLEWENQILWVIMQNRIVMVEYQQIVAEIFFPEKFVNGGIAFFETRLIDNWIYLLPYESNMFLAFNIKQKEYVVLRQYYEQMPHYMGMEIRDEWIYTISDYNQIHKLSYKNGNLEVISINGDNYGKVLCRGDYEVVAERVERSILDLQAITGENFQIEDVNCDRSKMIIGNEIYETIKKLV